MINITRIASIELQILIVVGIGLDKGGMKSGERQQKSPRSLRGGDADALAASEHSIRSNKEKEVF